MKKILTLYIIIIIMFIAGIYTLLSEGIIWFQYPSHKLFPVRGIDISHHQGRIDWEQIETQKDKYTFIYIKATEGADFKDSIFSYNFKKAKEKKFIYGAYHYYTLKSNGINQADNFIKTVPADSEALSPAVDLEFCGNSKIRPSKEQFLKELYEYLIIIEKHYKKKPILYVTYDFYEYYLTGTYAKYYSIWIRDIYKHPKLKSNQDWLFWQYNSKAHIKGINGFVDLNIFKGSLEDMKRLIAFKSYPEEQR